jgi:hypothetical protein
MIDPVMSWWTGLCAAALLNVAGWAYSATRLERRHGYLPRSTLDARRWLLWLSAIYVLGCAFRSFLPMVDVPRICLHDTWMSRIVIGRSVATIAELSFAMQWAILIWEAATVTRRRYARFVAMAIPALIVIAETASWVAVLSTNNLFHAIENSLWTAAAALAIATCAALRSYVDDRSRRFLNVTIACGAAYVLFMVTVDVPMYVSRWLSDTAAGHQNVPILDGLRVIAQRCRVLRDWTAWHDDVTWLSLYFTIAVWISIALPHVPALQAGTGRRFFKASAAAVRD